MPDGNHVRFYHRAIRCSVQKILMKQQVFVIKEHICQFSLLPVRTCRYPFYMMSIFYCVKIVPLKTMRRLQCVVVEWINKLLYSFSFVSLFFVALICGRQFTMHRIIPGLTSQTNRKPTRKIYIPACVFSDFTFTVVPANGFNLLVVWAK